MMMFMASLLEFLVAVTAILGGATVVITWMGIRYAEKKRGLTKGATHADLEAIRNDLDAIRRELQLLREAHADMTIMLHDLSHKALPQEKSEAPRS